MELRLAAKIDLNRSPEMDEERLAVRQLKGALNQLGWYMPDPKEGMNDEIDDGFKDAIYAYQRKSTIFYDDVDLGPGSTTERLLNEDLDYRERDYLFSGAYIWRTVGDEKVRGSHAVRNGQRFLWSQPPDGGHPSEDYNCRCWAEYVHPPYHPWVEWVQERRVQRLGQSATVDKLAGPRGLKLEPQIEEPKLDLGKAAGYTMTAAAALIILRLGGRVPLKTILNVIKAGKLSRSFPRQTKDQHIFKKPEGVPDDWIQIPTQKGDGVIFRPLNTTRTYVKIQKAKPDSPMPGQRYDNVRWQIKSKSLDVNGNVVPRRSMESHIPVKDFKFNPEKLK